jgi:hypothetical protein
VATKVTVKSVVIAFAGCVAASSSTASLTTPTSWRLMTIGEQGREHIAQRAHRGARPDRGARCPRRGEIRAQGRAATDLATLERLQAGYLMLRNYLQAAVVDAARRLTRWRRDVSAVVSSQLGATGGSTG